LQRGYGTHSEFALALKPSKIKTINVEVSA
jgi:hypothetical protein